MLFVVSLVLSTKFFSLAMAEMTTLVAAVYRKYHTTIRKGFEGKSPAITSRFELFFDDNFADIEVRDATNNREEHGADKEYRSMNAG